MKTRLRDVTLLLAFVLSPGAALADVYTWVDEQGTVHFQEAPPTDGKRAKKVDSLPAEGSRWRSSSAEVISPKAESRGEAAPASQEARQEQKAESAASKPQRAPSVELYTTSWCPWCKKAREYFRSRGIEFTDHDIDKDAGALERKIGIDGDKRVPTAVIGGKVVRGYSPSGYRAAIEGR